MIVVPVFDGPAEAYAPFDPPTSCDPVAKAGVKAFRDYVLARFGGHDISIARDCNQGAPSHHHEGRAWDWHVMANNPDDVTRVEAVFGWLFSPGSGGAHEVARRAGLNYAIWHKRLWLSTDPRWKAYDGFDDQGRCTRVACLNPHSDHVHFSFSKEGAAGQTSFYRWLNGGEPLEERPEPPTTVDPPRGQPSRFLVAAAWFAVGLAGSVAWAERKKRT